MIRFQIACAASLMPSGITGTFLALGALRLRRDGRRSPWSTLSSVGSGGGPRLPKKDRLRACEVLPSFDGGLEVLRGVVLLLGRAAHDHLGAGHLPQRGV